LHWLTWRNRGVDYLADSDIASGTNAATLAQAYDLIIFPGHHEYVTPREYQVVRAYRSQVATSRTCRPTTSTGTPSSTAIFCGARRLSDRWATRKRS